MMTLKKRSLCTLLEVGPLVLVILSLVVMIRLAVDTRVSAPRAMKQPTLPCGVIITITGRSYRM
jgi:hypothetical protein